MSNQNDPERLVDGPVRLRGEDGPDVEGHIRRVHTAHEGGLDAPAEDGAGIKAEGIEGLEDDGPDVEGHIFRA